MPARDPAPDVHAHDGFYLRLGIGIGYSSMSARDSESLTRRESTLSGLAVPIELAIGGTPVPGLVIGIGSYGAVVPSPRATNDGDDLDSDNSQVLSTFGPFVDYYFLPDRGFHAQAGFAFAVAPFTMNDPDLELETEASPKGWAAMVGVGWEAWVGEQWGIGALARVQYARLKLDELTAKSAGNEPASTDVDFTVQLLVPALLFTATLH